MTSNISTRYIDDGSLESDLRNLISETLWPSISLQISKNWLESLQTPIAAEVAMIKLNRIVSLATTSYDGVVRDNQEPIEKHIPDSEPIPASIDPWARGTGLLLNYMF